MYVFRFCFSLFYCCLYVVWRRADDINLLFVCKSAILFCKAATAACMRSLFCISFCRNTSFVFFVDFFFLYEKFSLWFILFRHIGDMSEKIETFSMRCKKLPARLREYNAFKTLKVQIEDFQVVLPILQEFTKVIKILSIIYFLVVIYFPDICFIAALLKICQIYLRS